MLIAKEIEVPQNSDEWLEARIGLVTSSELKNIFMDEDKAGYRNYKAQITIEQLTGKTPSRFIGNKFTDWGHDTEDLAIMEYSLKTGVQVRSCGIFVHNWLKLGDSPDGIAIDQPGCQEVKCKSSANHMETLRLGKMPPIHKPQVQNHIQMTGSKWCDYISFDPDFPPNARLFIQRIYKDEEYCKKIILQSSLFLDEVEKDINLIKGYEVQTSWN